jgi:F0F1-type ATP synthase assembly protein I
LAKREGLSRKQAAAYQGAVEAVLAVPISVGLGYWADRTFESAPVGLLVGAVLGFGALVLRLTRMRPDSDEAEEGAEAADRDDETGRG